MDTIIFIIVTIIVTFIAGAIIILTLKKLFNFFALSKQERIVDLTNRGSGLYFNNKNKKLEADQTPIAPF